MEYNLQGIPCQENVPVWLIYLKKKERAPHVSERSPQGMAPEMGDEMGDVAKYVNLPLEARADIPCKSAALPSCPVDSLSPLPEGPFVPAAREGGSGIRGIQPRVARPGWAHAMPTC